MKSICVVAHFAYGAMSGGDKGHIGGVEGQTSLMSRWLSSRGYRVSLLTWDEGQPQKTMIDGVEIIKMCRREDGLPGIRFFYPRWASLNRAMDLANAELYYQNCAEYVTGQVALWCKRHGRRFVYSVASDPDCDPRLPEMHTLRERILYRYGLKYADRVIVQTRRQKEMLKIGFGRDSVILPMPCSGPQRGEYHPPEPPGRDHGRVLWVGRIHHVKRPDLMMEIAGALPEVAFDVVGPPDADEVYLKNVSGRASRLPNMTFHGAVSRDRMPEFYQKASMLCCTSSYEGFPNAFLEAWSFGLPIVSTVDPGGLIQDLKLGMVGTEVRDIVTTIQKLMASPDLWREMSANARKYYLENHSVDSAMSRFERLFLEVLNPHSKPERKD